MQQKDKPLGTEKPTIGNAGTDEEWAVCQVREALGRLRFGEIVIRVYKGEATLVKVQEEFQRP